MEFEENGRLRVTTEVGDTSLTRQSMAADTDVNAILARHIRSGIPLPAAGTRPFSYGDFTGFGDYHEAMSLVVDAQRQFGQLPAHIRDYCDNDPGKFLELVYDPDRVGELEQLGLVAEQKPEGAAEPTPKPAEEAKPPAQ